MAKNKFSKILFGKAAWPIWLALATFGLTELFSRFHPVTEIIYSRTLYPVFAFLLSFLNKWVSFSLDDSLYALLAIFLITILLLTVFRKIKISRFLLFFIQTLAICYCLFYWFWGFNYFRSDLNERLFMAKSKPDTLAFRRVFEQLITETNASYCSFDSISKPEISKLVENSYHKNASFLKINYPQGVRVAKPITLSSFFAKAGIAGYYGPFFSEIHLNDSLLMAEYPQVIAHEMAHQFGVTSEAEANFYSWLVCSTCESKQLRYSANLNLMSYFLSQGNRLPRFRELVHQISKPVIDDMRKIQKHWANMRNDKIDKAAGKMNDAYLKSNKVKKGIDDYYGVVQFVMDFETDSLAQKRFHQKK